MDTKKPNLFKNITSLGCGGVASQLTEVSGRTQLLTALQNTSADEPIQIIGYGTNIIAPDKGIAHKVFRVVGGQLTVDLRLKTITADAGVWWDDLVIHAVNNGLWGVELMSGIPGGVGGAVVGNIAAYGQAIADCLQSVEVYNRRTQRIENMSNSQMNYAYRASSLSDQTASSAHLVVLSATFSLLVSQRKQIEYDSLINYAQAHNTNTTNLPDLRQIVIEVRRAAQSIFDYRDYAENERTAGSFFKNPLVNDNKTAEYIMSFDETGRSLERLKATNTVHGGQALRVSAAHVMLAAGFRRGQLFCGGNVALNPDHILKIQNINNASTQDIMSTVHHIQKTVQAKLGISLELEVKEL